jgi:hypothetical protein
MAKPLGDIRSYMVVPGVVKVVSGIRRVASYRRRSGWGRPRRRKALELGGNLIGSGGCLCCDSPERSDLSFIGSGR